jgi:hypothetical protein
MFKGLIWAAVIVVFFATKYGCGDPETQTYTPRTDATGGGAAATGGDATGGAASGGDATGGAADPTATCLASFTSNINPKIATCTAGACHVGSGLGTTKLIFTTASDASSRTAFITALKNKSITDGATFTAFISNASTHSGGVQTAITTTEVETWLTVEKATCSY